MLKFFFYWSLLNSMFLFNDEDTKLKKNKNKTNSSLINVNPIKFIVFTLGIIATILLLHISFNYVRNIMSDIK